MTDDIVLKILDGAVSLVIMYVVLREVMRESREREQRGNTREESNQARMDKMISQQLENMREVRNAIIAHNEKMTDLLISCVSAVSEKRPCRDDRTEST